MRRPEPLDPVVERDLATLEAALSGGPDAGPDAGLAALVRDVRAIAPRPAAAARAALDARVAERFARPPRRVTAAGGRRAARPRRSLFRRAFAPALASVAAALLVLVVVAGPLRGRDDGAATRTASGEVAPQTAGGSADSSAPAPSTQAGAGASSGAPAPSTAQPPLVAPAAPVPAAPARRVERAVRLDLGTRADRFDAVTDGVVRTTQRAGGFVADSRVRRDGGGGTASFVLRIPAGRLDAAVADLSRVAHVRSIEQGSTDLTGATDGTAARLRDAQTRRRALVAALATAAGPRAAHLRARLADARTRERSLDRALRALRARTAYATVDLTVTARRRAAAAAPGGSDRWTPADAWHDARRGLEIAAGVAIIALAVALPLALLGGLGALGAAAVRRRRREAALDVV